jgi:hypothetical protein
LEVTILSLRKQFRESDNYKLVGFLKLKQEYEREIAVAVIYKNTDTTLL